MSVTGPPIFADNGDDSPGKPDAAEFLTVGIGASAGGIQALKTFFQNVPKDSGIAYVVILHLSPDHDSKLAEVLQVAATIPVAQVLGRTKVHPNHVYVVPPNQHLAMVDGQISVSPNLQPEDRRAPVDIFFRTLADTHGSKAVCVVLSGTGANGSMGLKRVKEMGGAALVQNPREAEFNEMPRNAIATDLVDEVLPVAEIPAKIISYRDSLGKVRIPAEAEKRPEDLQQALRDIFTQLRVRTGHDFSNYKRPTLLRRIERRINIRNLSDLPAYAAFIAQNPDEIIALLKDLLISVTNFFRDRKAFDMIGQDVLPNFMHNKTSEDQLRIWVAGCATGEEAYSMAILCAEQTLSVIDAPKIQIFATDIDEAAIDHAREGYYTVNDAADVSPERLRRFFMKEGEGYRIRREIREMILFANHNFIKDPPFSHLDMVSCRNVLIYLNRAAQERVMETFHFALNPGGFLFLGSSESADGANDLYSIFSREYHIFQSRKKLVRSFPVPESVLTFRIEQPRLSPNNNERENRALERITFGDLHQRLLEEYAPPSVIVNEEYDVVHLSERAGRYLQVGGGELSQNLLKLVRPELRLELRGALYQATQRQTAVEARALKVVVGERTETINIHVRPVLREGDVAHGFVLILFEPTSGGGSGKEVVQASDDPVARHLEDELMRLKAQLRASIEQHEFHAEELKASNEELQAMNEELRSSAEELETSKEELQSINEELRTVNQELKVKIEETSLTSNNLQNLINSASIGTIFLDRSFRIALFTPAIREIFNLIPGDYGRPLSDITHHLEYDQLLHDAEIVLERLSTIEREVNTTDGRVFMMRVLPYRTAEDHINGVVITFIDMTTRKKAEEGLRSSEEKYRTVLATIEDGFCIVEVLFDGEGREVDYRFLEANAAFLRHTGISEDIAGKTSRELFNESEPRWLDIFSQVARTGESVYVEDEIGPQSSRGWYEINAMRSGDAVQHRVAVFFRDVTERTRAEQALRLSEERYRIALSSAEMAAWDWDVQYDTIVWNDQQYALLGLEGNNRTTNIALFLQFVHPDDLEAVHHELNTAVEETGVFRCEFRIRKADGGGIRWMCGYARAVDRKDGKATRMAGVMYDITKQKSVEQQKEEFISIASHELKTPVTSIKSYVEMLQEKLSRKDEKNAALIRKMDSQVDRLADLIKALLDTSRIAEDQLHLCLETFDLNQLIAERVEQLQRTTARHSLNFTPGGVAPVTADRERIGQVLTNLLSNGIKYSPGGGEILITTERTSDGVKVSVRDHGIGIPQDLLRKVFERFFRIGNPQIYTYPGMGLGLYISAGIIQRHGGTIFAESTPGDGSMFAFTLPYQAVQ
ncbi:MAG TPA: CheR family methyltransferase [Puia sp.]|nr:CheR family methyltransferase [Puia sp.]